MHWLSLNVMLLMILFSAHCVFTCYLVHFHWLEEIHHMNVYSVDPDQLADLDLHCFLRSKKNLKRICAQCVH